MSKNFTNPYALTTKVVEQKPVTLVNSKTWDEELKEKKAIVEKEWSRWATEGLLKVKLPKEGTITTSFYRITPNTIETFSGAILREGNRVALGVVAQHQIVINKLLNK